MEPNWEVRIWVRTGRCNKAVCRGAVCFSIALHLHPSTPPAHEQTAYKFQLTKGETAKCKIHVDSRGSPCRSFRPHLLTMHFALDSASHAVVKKLLWATAKLTEGWIVRRHIKTLPADKELRVLPIDVSLHLLETFLANVGTNDEFRYGLSSLAQPPKGK